MSNPFVAPAAVRAELYRSNGAPHASVSLTANTQSHLAQSTEEGESHPISIAVRTLGDAYIQVGEQQLTMQSALLCVLLLRLVYSPNMAVARDQLLRELWPEQEESRQRGNLRQALYKLRGMGVRITFRGDVVHLDSTQVRRTFAVAPSVELFERDVTQGSEPYGLFLPGFTPPTTELREWLEQTRAELHGDIRRVLADVLRARRERADWSGMQMVARWLLQLDPLNEDATLSLAECVAMTGSKVEAVGILDRYMTELGAGAGDIRLPAALLRKRFSEVPTKRHSVALVADKHFAGRDSELSEVTRALRRARWHDGSAVMLYGPPGIGKSRLMAEVLKVAQLEGYRDAIMECRESCATRPLGALIEAIPELLSAPGAMGCAPESLTILRRLLGTDANDLNGDQQEPTIAEFSSGMSPSERIELAMRTVRAQSIRHAVVDLFSAVSDERPIFLLVEDVHWLDNDSWEVLSDVIQRVREMRVYIVLTGRYRTVKEERPARIPATLAFKPLAPLQSQPLIALARAVSGDHNVDLSPEVESWVIGACEGNPLMMRALLEHWLATGHADGVPPTLVGLIDQRIDRLSGNAQQALQAIGLLGRFATLDRMKVVLELPVHELLHALEQLEMSGCLSTGQASLIIAHDLVRQVGIRRMSPLVDAALRAAIGDTLEAEYGRTGNLEILLEALTHTELSGRYDVLQSFIARYDAAFVEAGRPSTVLRAISTLHVALPKSRHDRKINRLRLNMESQNGSSGSALSLVPGGLSLPQDSRVLSAEEIDECLSFVEAAYRSSPMTDPATLAVFSASVVRNQMLTYEHRLRAADIGITIASNTCDSDIATACYHGLQISEQDSLDGERTQRLSMIFHTVFGSFDTAIRIADAIHRRNEDARATTGSVVECSRAGFVFRLAGDYKRATAALLLSIEMAKSIEAPRLAEYPVWQLAQLALESGNVQQATDWTRRLIESAESNNDEAANNYIFGHLCLMAIAQGKKKEAEARLSHCKRALAGIRPIRTVAYTTALELGVGLMDKRWIPSPPLLDAAVWYFERTGSYIAGDFLGSRIGESLARVGKSQEAGSLLRDYMVKRRRERSAPTTFLRDVMEKLNVRND